MRRQEIVDVAMRIIATEGARRFTAKGVAAELGMTAGALFRHFDSMTAIADAVVDRMEAMLFEGFPPTDDDPVIRLRSFYLQRVRIIVSQPHVARMLLSDHLRQAAGPVQAERVQAAKRRTRQFIVTTLDDVIARGRLAAERREETTVLIMGAVFALAHSRVGDADPDKLIALSERVWTQLTRLFDTT